MDAETRSMLVETAGRMFAELATREAINGLEKGEWPAALWAAVEEMGLPSLAVPEERGGAGGDIGDLCAVLRVAGGHAVPLPLAEAALAAHFAASAGLAPPAGLCTLAIGHGRDVQLQISGSGAGARVSGTARRVPFAARAAHIVVVAPAAGGGAAVAVVAAGSAKIVPGQSHAGEPSDIVTFDAAAPVAAAAFAPGVERAWELAALCRASQMAGAAQRIVDIAVEYAKQRVQFGRSISNFQAVQHLLAELASYAAAIVAAAEAAARDAEEGRPGFAAAAAKIEAGEHAHKTCAIAHQVMAAMGFTWEHVLHHYTRRLWVWRRDYGSESEWGEMLGRQLAALGPEGLWPALTDSRAAA